MNQIALLRRKEVQARTGLPRSSLYALMAKGGFPKPVRITEKAVGWPSNLVDDWITARIAGDAK